MNSLQSLRSQADTSAKWRGHTMHWSAPYYGESSSLQNGYCTHCGAKSQVITRPQPNEIDIAGSAVAMNCTFNPATADGVLS